MSVNQLTCLDPWSGPPSPFGNGWRAESGTDLHLVEAVVSNCPSGIAVLVGPDLVCELVNPAFRAFAPDKVMVGRPFAEAWPDMAEQVVSKAREVMDTGVPYSMTETPCQIRRSPEAHFEMTYFSFTCLPLHDSLSQYHALLVLAEETTRQVHERKRAEEEHQQLLAEVERRAEELEAAIASTPAGIVTYDPFGQVVRMNPAAETMLGYTLEEWRASLAGRAAMIHAETLDGKSLDMESIPTARALRGETVRGEIMAMSRRDGKTLWITAGAAPVVTPGGTIVGAVSAFADITLLQELQAQREEVIRAISHDLRQPITPMMGHASMLHRNLAIRGLDQEAQDAEAILKNTKRMNSMIQELVDSVRLEAGVFELHKEPTDLCYLITDLAARTVTAEEQAWLRVECPEPLPLVLVDWERIERAITNLIVNAFKYSPTSKPVTVRVERSGMDVVITVIDQGMGIAPKEQERLFHRFYRTGVGKKAGGLGLGLSITRQIVEAHGGRIWVESKPGEGSSFSISLPLGEEQSPAE